MVRIHAKISSSRPNCGHRHSVARAVCTRPALFRYSKFLSGLTSIVPYIAVVLLMALTNAAPHTVANAQNLNSQSFNQLSQDIELSISKTEVAYPMDGEKNVLLTIKNTASITKRIAVADDYVQSIVLTLLDESEIPVLTQPDIPSRRAKAISYRSLLLKQGEIFTFSVDITDYFEITSPGIYKIQAQFYPAFYDDENQNYVSSNPLLLAVNNFIANQEALEKINNAQETTEQTTLKKLRMYSPDTIVLKMLSALQNNKWDRFFTFMAVRSLYINTTISPDVFGTFSAVKQAQELVNFKQRIIRGTSNTIDFFAPDYFSIEDTYYTRTNARVNVLAYALHDKVISIKRYSFYLQKMDYIWKLVDFDARVIGSAPKNAMAQNIPSDRYSFRKKSYGSENIADSFSSDDEFKNIKPTTVIEDNLSDTDDANEQPDYATPDALATR